MSGVFKVLGAVLAVYTVRAVLAGEVYARSGMGGRVISKDESPRYFWLVIAIYSGLSLALVTVF